MANKNPSGLPQKQPNPVNKRFKASSPDKDVATTTPTTVKAQPGGEAPSKASEPNFVSWELTPF